jgi:hypothetical protein
MTTPLVRLVLLIICTAAGQAQAQQSERYGPFEVHYSVVNTTFLDPATAARYNIVRGKDKAILNIAVREHRGDGSTVARRARVEGRTWDLFQNQFFEFREIEESEAIYYIGEFEFSDKELRFFTINLLPEGAQRSYELKFQHKLYAD